tara:strand:- start:183 stop:488 length:306 start_codon:yes stop_codon:yes gene_type:complete
MAENVLSYPFRLSTEAPRFATVRTDTDTYKAEQINAFLKTVLGERAIFASFGTEDPTFADFDSSTFYQNFVEFYPDTDISIEEIEVIKSAGVLSDIRITFK